MQKTVSRLWLLFIVFSITGLFVSRGQGAILWKDDFSDELIFEITWDTENTTGTPHLENNLCVLNTTDQGNPPGEAIITLPSRVLPDNFDLLAAVELTNVEEDRGEFYIRIGGRYELVLSFLKEASEKDKKPCRSVFVRHALKKTCLSQSTDAPSRFPHTITSGERCFITWTCNGEMPALQMIKVGTNPGEADIADYLIETDEPVSGRVEIGIRKGVREVRLNYVRAYTFGTSSSLVHDWVLF